MDLKVYPFLCPFVPSANATDVCCFLCCNIMCVCEKVVEYVFCGFSQFFFFFRKTWRYTVGDFTIISIILQQ